MAQAIKQQRRYSVEDYQEWPDNEKWEIIDGILYDMSPAPRIKHQNIVGNFFLNFKTHPANPCYTGIAPTDVVLDAYSVVQPDVFIVCDGGKITENNIQGAPDLIVEVVSPGTEVKDRREKKRLYEQSGVKEYLIVFPEREYVERYVLEEGQYGSPEIFNWDEHLRLSIFPIEVKLAEIFEKENQTEAQERPAP